jgi:hypothetical protein
MTQHVVPFLHTPLEATEFLLFQKATARSGVVSGSDVSAGGSGYLISIDGGETIIDGSYVSDDLDKIDAIDLGHISGSDKHYIVYQTYSFVASDPPAASLFLATAGAVPPTQPVLPAGAVKLADIFIPASAVTIASAGVRIVNTPKLASRADTGELIDRLVQSVGNTIVYTAGSITYDDAGSKLFFTQSVVIQALVSTNRTQFQEAPPLVRATIPSAVGGLTVPGTPGSRDVIVYALVDRSVPNTGLAATVKFLDRTNPGGTELAELLDPLNYTKIVILATIIGSKIHFHNVEGAGLPLADVDNRKFLRNDPSGVHVWDLLDDVYFKGGSHVGLANTTARDAIASDLRKQGSIAYSIADDEYFGLIGGVANGNWKDLFDDSRVAGGLHCVADATARQAIPFNRQKTNMLVMQADTKEVWRLQTPNNGTPVFTRLFKWVGTTSPDGLQFDKILIDGPDGLITITPLLATDGISIGTNGIATQGGTITPYSAAISQALQKTHHSHVIHGCELCPDIESLGGGNSGPRARVKAGDLVTAGGAPIHISADIFAGAGDMINDVAIPAGPATVYVYFRRTTGFTGEIRMSASSPDILGQPTDATLDGASVASDYCYLGFLRYQDESNAGGAAGVWGNFYVTHMENGRRHVHFDPEEAALKAHAVSGSLADSATADVAPLLDPSIAGGIGAELEIDIDIFWSGLSGARTGVTATAPGLNLQHNIFDTPTDHMQKRIIRSGPASGNPSQNPSAFSVHVVAHTSGSNIVINVDARLVGIIENVNQVREIDA